jgi:chemotaxis signal transduction protein
MKGSGADWERARARLRASEIALEESLTASPSRIADVYRTRAERLAKKDARQTQKVAGLPVLVFCLGRDRYAIEAQSVAEALRFERCRQTPGSSPLWRGVMNVRGELRAVMDLSHLLSRPPDQAAESSFVLMVRWSGPEIGLKVDRIEGMSEIRADELDHAPPGRYVKTISGGVMLLDLKAIETEAFSNEELLSK